MAHDGKLPVENIGMRNSFMARILSELLCTAGSTTAMELSSACFSTRSLGFNLSFAPRHALSSAYPSGPVFWTQCTTNTTLAPLPRNLWAPRVDFPCWSKAWNCLPPSLKDPNITFSVFKKLLKTELFQH